MRQILEKFQNVFLEGLEKLENENTAEALQKFKEVSGIFPELLEKTSEAEVELKKYAELLVTAENSEKLIEELQTLNWKIETVSKSLDKLKEEKEADDKVISENLNKIFDTFEKMWTVTVSKIED